MGQVLHGSATTTHAVRAAIQRSTASIAALSRTYNINPKTVAKWKSRAGVRDAAMGPKQPRSTVLSKQEEVLAVAFRRYTLLPLDDCLYALQATIPHLTRSSLHRLFQRHGISRLPDVQGDKPKKKSKAYPIGYFHIDIAEVWTQEGKLDMFVAVDRTRKFAFAELHERATRRCRSGLPQKVDPSGPVPHPHGADRQQHTLDRSERQQPNRNLGQAIAHRESVVPLPCVRVGLRSEQH